MLTRAAFVAIPPLLSPTATTRAMSHRHHHHHLMLLLLPMQAVSAAIPLHPSPIATIQVMYPPLSTRAASAATPPPHSPTATTQVTYPPSILPTTFTTKLL